MNNLSSKNMLLTAAIISTLAACGGGTDASSPASTTTPVTSVDTSGQVVNSYITEASVTLDLNDDGICDATEPETTTDATGHYLFSGKGAHIVCATGGTNTVTEIGRAHV